MIEPARKPTPLPFKVSALLFDLDNTLFDRDRAFMSWAEAFVQTRLASQDDLRPPPHLNVAASPSAS